MASALLPIALLSLLLYSSATRHHKPPPYASKPGSGAIHEACKASGDPVTCESFLSKSIHLPPNATASQVIQSILLASSEDLEKAKGMAKNILDGSTGNLNRSNAAKTCLEVLRYSDYRINLTKDALKRGKIKDARAWASAALVYQYDCWSALKYVNGTALVDDTMSFLNSTLIFLSSNALSMMQNYDIYGGKTGSWGPPRTERDGFWEPVSDNSGSGVTLSVPAGLKADVTVCKSCGECNYTTVQEAVNAAPDNIGSGKLFVIWIKTGVYEETVRVRLKKRNVVFLGDGIGKTVITGSKNVGQPGMSTFNSATVGVLGDGFMASDLTIKNTAGPDAHQAVAFRSDSDHSIVQNCEFLGNQDTLYAHSLRQYYKSCRIQGNVDFIFGNSAAFFQDCLILIAPRQINPEKGEKNAVTAHGRIHPGQTSGFVFQNCLINGTEAYMALYHSKPTVHKSYLGRPWKEYSRTVFIHCTLEALIDSDGWMPWSEDFALKTLYYGEFADTGLGSNPSKRVNWSSLIPEIYHGLRHLSSHFSTVSGTVLVQARDLGKLNEELENAIDERRLNDAWDLHEKHMRVEGFARKSTLAKLISSLAQSLDLQWVERAYCLVEKAFEENKPTLFDGEILMFLSLGLAKCGLSVPSSILLRKLIAMEQFPPVAAWSAIIAYMSENSSGAYLAAELTLEIGYLFQDSRIDPRKKSNKPLIAMKPNVTAFNIALVGCLLFGTTRKAEQLLEMMPRINMKPDATLLIVMAHVYERNGRREDLKKIKRHIEEAHSVTDIQIRQFYNFLLSCHLKFGDLDSASAMVLEMLHKAKKAQNSLGVANLIFETHKSGTMPSNQDVSEKDVCQIKSDQAEKPRERELAIEERWIQGE